MSEPDPAAEVAALRAALAAERLKGELFAEQGNELRALVKGVLGVTGLLLDTDLTPEQRGHVERARALSDALAGIVNDLLDAQRRREAGKLDPDRERRPAGDGVASPPPASRRRAPSSRRVTPAPLERSSSSPPARARKDGEERPRLLLVEDNAVNQRVTKTMMEKRGYRVEVAGDGLEAVALTAQGAFAAVLMDCHMPRLDGYAATREIRAREAPPGPRLPIIAMTANAGPDARERCLAAGMDDYVSKPVTADALDAVLRRWVPRGPTRAETPPPPPPQPRRSSSPAIDLGMLRQMRAAQGPDESDIVAEVVALFLQDAPERLTTLRDAAARGDLAAASRVAHTLKGSAGHLGARALTTLCERFERKVRAGAPFDVPSTVGAIAEELDRVRAELAKEGE